MASFVANRGARSGARGGGARRYLLAGLSLSMLAGPHVAAGCAANFDPPSKVEGLRVLAVTADTPYVKLEPPGEDGTIPDAQVHFTMTLSRDFTEEECASSFSSVQILWLGGCVDPQGDQYYACYQQLASVFSGLAEGKPPPPGLVGGGTCQREFTLTIPGDIIERRPAPPYGPHYGIAYLFFVACAGTIGPVPDLGTGRAPDFPLGCFNADGQRLGPDSFVPGYTQIYAFADRRENNNPKIDGLTLGGEELLEDPAPEALPTVKACPLTDDERRSGGCDVDIPASCEPIELKALIAANQAEIDPDATGENGNTLTEAMWVGYYADGGDTSPSLKLVNDSVSGYNSDLGVQWVPPAEPGPVTLWAVLRDARGGSAVVKRQVMVEP